MRTISQLNAVIEERVSELSSDRARALCKPISENGRRFLSSDICIRIARRRGIEPAQLALNALAKIRKEDGELWSQHAGYINVGGEFESCIEAVEKQSAPVAVYLPARPKQVSVEGMLRLSARAIIQCWLARESACSVTLNFGDRARVISRTDSLYELFYEAHEFCARVRGADQRVDEQVLSFYTSHQDADCAFLLCPGDVDHHLWKRGGALPGFDEQAHVHIADRGWIGNLDRAPQSLEFLQLDAQRTPALLMHLGSALRGVEIEWQMPCYSEQNNLPWKLSSLRERLNNVAAQALPVQSDELSGYIGAETAFFIRYLKVFHQGSARWGEIPEFISALNGILNQTSLLLNDPKLRIEQATGNGRMSAIYATLSKVLGQISSFFYVD